MITTIQFKTLDDLYQFYNDAIFNGELSECIVNMSRHGGAFGFFAANRWRGDGQEKKVVHEISINPDFMNREIGTGILPWYMKCAICGRRISAGRAGEGSHNSQWADKMIQVGLMPSDTGEAGGKRTGQSITHYIIPGGKFEQVFNTLSREDLQNLRLRYKPTLAAVPTRPIRIAGSDGDETEEPEDPDEGESKSGKRKKYTCGCGCNVWGKSGLVLRCGLCDTDFTEQ